MPRLGRAGLALAVSALLAAATGACGSDQPAANADPDNGTKITLWTRAATQRQSQLLVDAYNAKFKNKVELTAVPSDNYAPRIAAAAGANSLPDIFAADVIFAPNYTSKNLYRDITDKINALPFKDNLAKSHLQLGTYQNKMYAVPHTIDVSLMMWNKKLYRDAGLDPEKGPTSLAEMATHARAIDKLPGDINGTVFGGNCGGCMVFTFWPSVW